MKSIMLSIRPKWCELIANGTKTIEVRKTKPKLNAPFKCYIYETKGATDKGCGKVIAEFVCDQIITVDCDSVHPFDKATGEYINDKLCLDRDEFWEYTHGRCAYGWHISDLVIFDKPKALSEYGLKRAPQSWFYVEQEG